MEHNGRTTDAPSRELQAQRKEHRKHGVKKSYYIIIHNIITRLKIAAHRRRTRTRRRRRRTKTKTGPQREVTYVSDVKKKP